MTHAVSIPQIEEWLVSGQPEQAKEACLDLLAEHPSDPDLRTLLALTEELTGHPQQAIAQLESVLGTDPEHVRTLFHLARLLLETEDAIRSEELLDTCIALSPNHAPSRALWARLQHRLGHIDSAIEGLRIALRADEKYLPALCDLAVLLVETGKVEEARDYATQAVELDPAEGAAQLAMGVVLEAQGHLSFAEQCLKNATDQNPDSFQGLMALARVYQRQGRHQESLATLDRLSDEQKQIPAARFARAFSLARLGQPQPARALFEALLVERPDPKTLLQLMDLYIQTNDYPALVELSTSVDRTINGVGEAASFLDARLEEFQGHFDQALELLHPLLETAHRDLRIRVHLVLARVALKKGDAPTAVEPLEQLAEQAGLPHPVRWEIAQLAEQAGDAELALRVINTVLADKTIDTKSLARTATMKFHLLDSLGRYEEAKALIDQDDCTMGWLPVPGPLMSSALPVFDRESFSITGADEDHQSLIWVLGWPWAGRELVLAALAQIEGAQMLPLAEGATRHEHLGLFAGEPYSVQIDQDQIHQMRRRYLRGADENAKVWVDPYPCKAADLIRMRQVFPKSVAIRVNCSPEYLALQWHLAGYAAVDSMIEAWKSEQAALDHLMDSPEIRIISVSLDALLDPQRCAETVVELISALGQSANPKMSAHVQALIQRHGYRSPNHWEYYFK